MIRKWVPLFGLLAALVFGGTASAEMSAHEKKLYEAAKANGEEVTWYLSQFNGEVAALIGRAFEEAYPGIKANVVRTTAQVAFQRLSQDLKFQTANCDVLSSSDLSHYTMLKEEGHLEQYTPENSTRIMKALQGFDPDGYYHVTSVGTVLITYNTDKVKPEDAPKNWTDLADPKWKGQVGLGHPGFSGYMGSWVVTMRKLYGWEFFEKLEENEPQIGRSINDTVTMLNSGERTVAIGSGSTTLLNAARGNPLGVVYPEDGAVLMINASAMLKNSKNPNAARLFMEFLQSAEAAKLEAANNYDIIRPDVPPYQGARDLDEVKTIRPTIEEVEKGVPEVKELWRQTFGV